MRLNWKISHHSSEVLLRHGTTIGCICNVTGQMVSPVSQMSVCAQESYAEGNLPASWVLLLPNGLHVAHRENIVAFIKHAKPGYHP